MPLIHLTTFISAPADRVFDLCRSISFHRVTMNKYKEQAVDGKMSGLLNLNETVTWKSKHLFKERILKSKIIQLNKPFVFIDQQVQGDFKEMKHEHFFKLCDNGTIMIDQFYFEMPYGMIGKWINHLYLTNYLKKLLEDRNKAIKKVAESNQWRHYLIES